MIGAIETERVPMKTQIAIASLHLLAFSLLPAAEVAEFKEGDLVVKYVVEAPAGIATAATTDPAKQVGLFLCMHEHDRPTGDELMPVRQALRSLGLTNQFVLLAISPQTRKYGADAHAPISKMIAWAKKTYPINPRRIYSYGKGEGSKISNEFVGLHPDLVAAAIGYSWGFWKMPVELKEPLKHAPRTYMVLGLQDLAHHLTNMRDAYERVSAKGYHLIYREFDGLSARSYHPPSNDDAIAWASRVRNPNVPLSREESKLLKSFDGAPPAPSAGGYYPALSLVGGSEAGAVVRKLLDSKDAMVRAAAADTCSRGMFDEPTMEALGLKLADPSANVRQAAIRALGMQANWRSAAAQEALIRLTSDPSASLEDRIGAVDAIGYAVRYQVKGFRQDPAMFAALIALQSGKEEELRNMANAILLPIRDTVYKPVPRSTDRAAASRAWKQWLDQITEKAAGIRADYKVCAQGKSSDEAVNLYCEGGAHWLGRDAAGKSVPRNYELAFQNTLRAAEKGNASAQTALGMMYANGTGVEQDYAEAAKW